MADSKAPQTAGQNPVDPLSAFLAELEKLPQATVAGMLKQTEDADEKEVIRSLGATLENQVSQMSGYLRELAGRLSLQQRQELDLALRLAAAGSVVSSALQLAGKLASPAVKLSLGGIFRENKKILIIILEVIFAGRLPGWILWWFLLVDEHYDRLLSVGSSRLAAALSRMEQEFLAEVTQATRWVRESQRFNSTEDEED
jgi:hypothetical protein